MTFIKVGTMTMLVAMAAVAAPVMAAAADATLYELTENTTMTPGRVAASELMGFAAVGSPLCPKAVVDVLNPRATRCSVKATGGDNISTRTGLGDFDGRFTVAVPGDNPFDGPELILMSGTFRGRMDFSPALVKGLPFGTVAGTMSVGSDDDEHDSFRSLPFTGVFRLPFAGSVTIPASGVGKASRRLALCQATPQPNSKAQFYGGYDLAYLDHGSDAWRSRCINIHPAETSLGEATVRFDILF